MFMSATIFRCDCSIRFCIYSEEPAKASILLLSLALRVSPTMMVEHAMPELN
jgi:hypothetical protein